MAVQQQFETFSPVLHSLRGFAAVAVLLFHWEQHFPAGGHWLQQFFQRKPYSIPPFTLALAGWASPSFLFSRAGCWARK